ncbi:uncharacterized protein LOC121054961 [Oryza brachyantha]|uniref:uncharacterized protein LOC121054961 n=1 Tax=Oryza brachyantha TaxID=4533 RepID=UPI001ADB84D1|nr:uncharacterized protein LOC121054961 [Oryza brachyantha]
MNHLSLLHHPILLLPQLSPRIRHRHGRASVVQARLIPSPDPTPTNPRRPLAVTNPSPPPLPQPEPEETKRTLAEAEGEEDGGRTCGLPTWALVGGITAGVAAALALSAGAGPAAALGPEGPLVEEFWDNMRRYALYALTVSTGVAYTLLQPIVELLKNPVTALLIIAVIAGSGFLVSQVLNAMVGNSDFIYDYAQ